MGSPIGNYWVIDTDGWCYWAAPVQPDTATGLLLKSVDRILDPDDSYYYAINVIARMATKAGNENYTDFYKDATAEGCDLLDKIAGGSESGNPGSPGNPGDPGNPVNPGNDVADLIRNGIAKGEVRIDDIDWYIAETVNSGGERYALLIAKKQLIPAGTKYSTNGSTEYEGSNAQAKMTTFYFRKLYP